MKVCTQCLEHKELTEFNIGNSSLGRESRCRICKAEWRRRNIEWLTAYEKSDKRAKKHLEREYKRRKWKKAQGDGTLPRDMNKKIIEILFSRQDGKCAVTGNPLIVNGKLIAHTDHIMPLSRGGVHSLENIQLVIPKINLSKGTKTMEEFTNGLKTATVAFNFLKS